MRKRGFVAAIAISTAFLGVTSIALKGGVTSLFEVKSSSTSITHADFSLACGTLGENLSAVSDGMKFKSSKNPTIIKYDGKSDFDYVNIECRVRWATVVTGGVTMGIVVRGGGEYEAAYLVKRGTQQANPRALKYTKDGSYKTVDAEYSCEIGDGPSFTNQGSVFWLKAYLHKGTGEKEGKDLLTTYMKIGDDEATPYSTIYEDIELDTSLTGKKGWVGFLCGEATLSIGSVTITDLNNCNTYEGTLAK